MLRGDFCPQASRSRQGETLQSQRSLLQGDIFSDFVRTLRSMRTALDKCQFKGNNYLGPTFLSSVFDNTVWKKIASLNIHTYAMVLFNIFRTASQSPIEANEFRLGLSGLSYFLILELGVFIERGCCNVDT
jgi:hypothetical protein